MSVLTRSELICEGQRVARKGLSFADNQPVMACLTLNKAPTAFEELRILEAIYVSAEELRARLGSYGYKILTDVKIPDVRCFLFVAHAFPSTRREVGFLAPRAR